jgi:hypothetical protein
MAIIAQRKIVRKDSFAIVAPEIAGLEPKENFWFFDSKFEYLIGYLLHQRGIEFRLHEPVTLLKASLFFGAIDWKCDFYLPDTNIYLEAKEMPNDREFSLKLKILAKERPGTFQSLLIVCPDKIGNRYEKQSAYSHWKNVCKGQVRVCRFNELNSHLPIVKNFERHG